MQPHLFLKEKSPSYFHLSQEGEKLLPHSVLIQGGKSKVKEPCCEKYFN